MNKITQSLFLVLCVFSTAMLAQNSSNPITKQLTDFVGQEELMPQDVQWQVTSETVSSTSGIQHIYFRQLLNEIEIYGTDSSIHTMGNGKVLSQSNKFIKNTADKLSGATQPGLTAAQAVQAAAMQLGYTVEGSFSEIEKAQGVAKKTLLSEGGVSLRPIPVQLMYAITDNGSLVLSWDLSIQGKTDWWSVRVNATTGKIVNRANWMVSCASDHDHSDDVKEMNFNTNLYDIPNYNELVSNQAAACTECYEVFALPLESPYYGDRTIEVLPADPIASPYGWHDTDGVAGAEYTVTRGNNADAYEDGDNPGYQPDGGTNLDFTGYPFDQHYTNSNQYEDAAITNLFYINNVFHDILYQYGFDEVAGNFQENNYGKGGLGNDYVFAEAQDGSGTCNANFGTPPDGSNPVMQMYICGDKDGDFDNLVIMHEYGHGVSNRLTGGPSAVYCLQNTEQMGEGWSDLLGVLLTIQPDDVGSDSRAVGTYLFGQGIDGDGIREYPYSTDMNINPQTYDFIKNAIAPHGVGSVWAQMLWEMTWGLIDAHGYDPNPYNFTGDVSQDSGNIMAMALVIEGMKLQPCSPGFVDGRDAILAADQALYDGANECIIWEAFAKRGLGYSADQGSTNSKTDGTEAFDLPSPEAEGVADYCPGETVTVTATPIDSANSIEWYDAPTDGNLLFSGESYTFTPTGDIDVYAEEIPVSGSLCNSRALASVTIDSIDPTITCPEDEIVSVEAGEQYPLPDYITSTTATDNCSQEPVVTQDPAAGTLLDAGETTITMTATDAADNEATCTFTVTVDELVGVDDNEFANNLVLYPNPTNGSITLINKTASQLSNIIITDVKGRVIKTLNLSGAGIETNFSLVDLASGMYFVKINAENATVIKRIVKQ
ncbi:MAG: M36 family metallopeptidase [Aequorivita sp.]